MTVAIQGLGAEAGATVSSQGVFAGEAAVLAISAQASTFTSRGRSPSASMVATIGWWTSRSRLARATTTAGPNSGSRSASCSGRGDSRSAPGDVETDCSFCHWADDPNQQLVRRHESDALSAEPPSTRGALRLRRNSTCSPR